MNYIIYDHITDEVLSVYNDKDPNLWRWSYTSLGDDLVRDAHIFTTLKDARKAKQHLSLVFTDDNQEVDFQIFSVAPVPAVFRLKQRIK